MLRSWSVTRRPGLPVLVCLTLAGGCRTTEPQPARGPSPQPTVSAPLSRTAASGPTDASPVQAASFFKPSEPTKSPPSQSFPPGAITLDALTAAAVGRNPRLARAAF